MRLLVLISRLVARSTRQRNERPRGFGSSGCDLESEEKVRLALAFGLGFLTQSFIYYLSGAI